MSLSISPPVVLGIAGIGGYAGSIRNLVLSCAKPHPQLGGPWIRLAAVCEPDQELHQETIAQLRQQGVAVHSDLTSMLRDPIEAVWLPVPIHLHRPFAEQALAAGKAVMCEKPAAGSIDDVDAMIAARDRAGLPLAIGYQDIYSSITPAIKDALAQGGIGQITHATLCACWPRGADYYSRANWAGALKRNGTWVLDSPVNNALAHYLNVALFFLGPTAGESAQPRNVTAELYRVNPIENYDTVSMRLTLDGGVTVLVNFTHACAVPHHPRLTIHGQRGRLRWLSQGDPVLEDADGRPVQTFKRTGLRRENMIKRFACAVRGLACPDVALATLEVARAQALAVNGASEASPVRTIDDQFVRVVQPALGGDLRTIVGVEQIVDVCDQRNQMLHESGLCPWTSPPGPPGSRDLTGYRHFAGPALLPVEAK